MENKSYYYKYADKKIVNNFFDQNQPLLMVCSLRMNAKT